MSYFDAYIDPTGEIEGFARFDLRLSAATTGASRGRTCGRSSASLIDVPHQRIKVPRKRVRVMRARYLAYREKYGKKPLFYRGRKNWTPPKNIERQRR